MARQSVTFLPISTAWSNVAPGQVALLLMPCGCEAKCVFEERENESGVEVYAWWPYDEAGAAIGFMSPLGWFPLFNEREAKVQ